MWQRVQTILRVPAFEGDAEQVSVARHLHIMIWLSIAAIFFFAVSLPIFAPQLIAREIALAPMLAIQLIALGLLRQSRVRLAAYTALLGVWAVLGLLAALSGGIRSAPYTGNVILVLLAAILLGQRAGIVLALLSFCQGLGLVWLERLGWLPPISSTPESTLLLQTTFFIVGAGTLHYATFSIKDALKRAQRELSERQSIENAKRQSDSDLKALLNAYSDTAFLIDPDGKFIAVNDTVVKQFGRSFDELIGTSAYALLPAPLAAERKAKIDQAVRTRQPVRFIDRGAGWNDNSVFPILDAHGNVTRVAIYARDITDYKSAEQKLIESEQKFRNIVEASPMGMHLYRLDADACLRLIGANPAAQRILGIDHQPLLGKPIEEIFPGLALVAEHFRQVCATGKPWHLEQLDLADPFFYGAFEFHAFQTTPGLMAVLFMDVTERQHAEQARRASEERYRVVSELISDYAYAYQVAPDQSLKTAWMTEDSFTRVTGYAWSEIGATYKLYHPDDAALAQQHVAATLNGHDTPGEYRILTKGGELKWLAIRRRGQWDAPAQRVVRMYGAAQDITERKRAEADREMLIQELETKNAELERFTYTVSHDLKAPLITIQGFAGFIEQDARAGNSARLKGDLARITDATAKMTQLLNELLELSRIGRLMNPPEDVPFAEIVRDALDLVRGRLNVRHIDVVIDDALPVVRGDRARLIEVVQNLVDNAAKFIGAQPAPQIHIGARGADAAGRAILLVRDNGSGIDQKYHERIFGLFNKLDPQSEGTGVGLALVKRIVEVHGGKIWVESAGVGKGATFYFTLPLQPTP